MTSTTKDPELSAQDSEAVVQQERRPSVVSQSYFRSGDITEHYLIGQIIGKGHYAEVRVATNKKSGEKVAIKILQKQSQRLEDILNEIDILARVDDHPNVVQLREIFEKKGRIFVVMEYVAGGDLFDRVTKRKCFPERDARSVMTVLVYTIRHMHEHGIVHRDLKPENILFATASEDSPIKIADFGLAKLWTPTEDGSSELKTLCGTPCYVAPEVLKGLEGYTSQCDMWSLGVILYILLCGYPPFQHDQQPKLFKQILKADFQLHSPWWDRVSDEAKDLVCKLLVVDPAVRLTPRQALAHPWMQPETEADSSAMDIRNLSNYESQLHKRKFKKFTNTITAVNRLAHLSTSSTCSPVLNERSRNSGATPQPMLSSRTPPPHRHNTNHHHQQQQQHSDTSSESASTPPLPRSRFGLSFARYKSIAALNSISHKQSPSESKN